MKKVNIFCHESETHILYTVDSSHRVKYFKPLFIEIFIIMAYR